MKVKNTKASKMIGRRERAEEISPSIQYSFTANYNNNNNRVEGKPSRNG